MLSESYFELTYNDSANPCVVSDRITNEVVFMNKAMAKLLENYPQNLGNTCYNVIHHSSHPCEKCDKDAMFTGEYTERFMKHDIVDRDFRVNTTVIDLKGKQYNMCKYFETHTLNTEFSFEDAMTEYAEAIASDDVHFVINSFLDILGRFYNCEKTYIFQFDTKQLKRQYYWTKNKKILNLEAVDEPEKIKLIINYFEDKSEFGIIEFDTTSSDFELNSSEKTILDSYDVKNLILSAIEGVNGEIVGFLGITNRENVDKRVDYRLLKAVTKFVEQNIHENTAVSELKNINDIDFLTGFYSRKKYATDVEMLFEENYGEIGVIFININGLRWTNENLGYDAGDKKIFHTAEILKRSIPTSFYRVSGDEFICFLININENDFNEKVAELRNAFAKNGENLCSIGNAHRVGKNINILQLVSEADTVMYINKQEYYHSENKVDFKKASKEALSDLMYAIENDEFMLYLQPKVNLINGEIAGAEALIRRYDTRKNKMIFPDQFIALYEQNSIIRHVDIWMFEKVCETLSKWKNFDKQPPISVNLSRVTLMEHNILDTISDICKKYEVSPELIVIEITERIGLVEFEITTEFINAFKERGFKLSLDDFGCAYSNIVILAKIDVDEVKVDKSLVDELMYNKKNRIIVENILNMCTSFENTSAVAEGIEISEQAEILKRCGCIYGQGYHFSRPIPHNDFFEKYINKV